MSPLLLALVGLGIGAVGVTAAVLACNAVWWLVRAGLRAISRRPRCHDRLNGQR